MILNRECDYAFRIMRVLSDGYKKTVETICDAESIPKPYAYKLLKKLESAGFLQSIRGRDGGYRLIRNTNDFTMYDVVVTINKDFLFNECLVKGAICKRMEKEGKLYCKFHIRIQELQDALESELKKYSVAEILEKPHEYNLSK